MAQALKILGIMVAFFLCVVLVILGVVYYNQESMLFQPKKIRKITGITFDAPFKEESIRVDAATELSGGLFTTKNPKGLVLFLHGNAGALDTWGNAADVYLENNYDVFVLDYRGFGKSDGQITNEAQLYSDVQTVYDTLKRRYSEEKITIVGYSIGTGFAAYLAANNTPKRLILLAPYYNMPDLVEHLYGINPRFLLKYKLPTNEFFPKIKAPVAIFHGDSDYLIYQGASEKLKQFFKPNDEYFTLIGQGHIGVNEHSVYKRELKRILAE